jgi:hypothetical protein
MFLHTFWRIFIIESVDDSIFYPNFLSQSEQEINMKV